MLTYCLMFVYVYIVDILLILWSLHDQDFTYEKSF